MDLLSGWYRCYRDDAVVVFAVAAAPEACDVSETVSRPRKRTHNSIFDAGFFDEGDRKSVV